MKTTIDIKKAHYCSFGYVNQEGSIRNREPILPTVNGIIIIVSNDYAYPLDHNFPKETMFERAARLDIVDRWTPIIIFTFTKYDTITIKGDRAIELYEVWNAFIFSKQNKNSKNKQKDK